LTSSREECSFAESLTRAELSKLGLSLSESKTETLAPEEPVEFLGMELGLKSGTSRYSLTISTKQQDSIRDQFTSLHDVDFAIKEGLDLPKLLRRLENMKSGYRAAYGVADNFASFDQKLDQWAGNCVIKVYTSMFDATAISKLRPKQRRFLLIPELM